MSSRGPNSGHEPGRDLRPGGDQESLRQEGDPRLERAVAKHVLHVERLEVPGPEQRAEHHQHHRVASRDRARPEDVQRDERSLREAGLEDEEDGEEHHGQRERHQHLGRPPRVGLGAHEGEHQRHEAGRHGDRPGEVEVTLRHVGPRLGEVTAGRHQCHGSDGHVDEQDPAPVQEVGQDPAEERAGRGAPGRDGAPHSQCPGAGRTLGERRGQNGQGRRGEDGGAETLQRPGADQPGLALGHASEEAGDGEHGQAHHEDPPSAEQVGRPAAEKEEPGESQV